MAFLLFAAAQPASMRGFVPKTAGEGTRTAFNDEGFCEGEKKRSVDHRVGRGGGFFCIAGAKKNSSLRCRVLYKRDIAGTICRS